MIKKRINFKYNQVFGLNVLPDIQAIPTAANLAVVATPMATVSGVISGCTACGIATALVIAAGGRDTGTQGVGAQLLIYLLKIARQRGIQIVYGSVLRENWHMQRLGKKVGFEVAFNADKGHDDRTIDLTRARVCVRPTLYGGRPEGKRRAS